MIAHDRKEDPTFFTNFERLVNLMKQVEKEKIGTPPSYAQDEIEDFYKHEQKLISVNAAK